MEGGGGCSYVKKETVKGYGKNREKLFVWIFNSFSSEHPDCKDKSVASS